MVPADSLLVGSFVEEDKMAVQTNANFERLLGAIQDLGGDAHVRASDMEDYRKFLAAFPLQRLPTLTADEYCVGKGNESFCWWLERGLEHALGRYMPGSSKGHIVYFVRKDGAVYKNRHLADLTDDEAVRYTTRIQATIASADLSQDLRWIDDDGEVFKRAGLAPRVTVGHARKLRLLACYHPDDVIPISSSAHIGHYLAALGCPASEIPYEGQPVARMLKLREYFELAKESSPDLTTRGFMRALYSPKLGIAPERPDDEADTPPDDEDLAAPAYLLTWNPEHFKLGGDGAVTPGTEHRWTCHSKQPKAGDTVYLIRLGVEPRGIVARGTVTKESFEAHHWKDPTKTARYIAFRVEEFRPTAESGLLPMVLLSIAIPNQKWSPQSSGVGISAQAERALRDLWEAGSDVHSLGQLTAWFTANLEARRDQWHDWLIDYRKTTALAKSLKADPARIDEAALDKLWRIPSNGVSHVGPGTLSSKEFTENLPLLEELTQKILANPTGEALADVEASWSQAVAAKRLRMLNRAVIRRMFAAASPERFTTLVREADCQKVLALFKRQFELEPVRSAGSNWAALNADLAACMAEAHLSADRAVERNMMVWRLVEYLSADDKPVPAEPENLEVDTEPEAQSPQTAPRNVILYGAPGTGKTYQTIEEAISILAPEMLEGEPDRKSIKAKFDDFVRSGRVVFTTFHQSFSYEDFVEGLRAETDEGGQLRYRVVDGVFKQICGHGTASAAPSANEASLPFRQGDEVGGYQVVRCTADVLELRKPNGKELPVGMSLLNELATLVRNGRITIDDIKQRQVFEKVPDTKLEPYLVNGYQNVLPSIVERIVAGASRAASAAGRSRDDSPKVLIIDEINRGNVARIFGELITLIEPSKRAGMPEALSVTLPYSKTRFSVPSSLHIVATMNTADRSLVGLDIALRRRFEFRELEPRPELLDDVSVDGVSVGALLRAMNERIELLLDRDHRLGHAYFLGLRESPTISDLGRVFLANILPLLQEYFFEDWERIRWVLNDHRKPVPLQFLCMPQAGVDRLFGDGVSLNSQAVRWSLNEKAFLLPEAYAGIVTATA